MKRQDHPFRLSNARYTGGYILLFGLLASLNRYDIWLNLPPASIHQWRQADGAAIAWHYAQNPDFGTVSICNLFYTNDAHAVGEWPLLYWLAGLIGHLSHTPAFPLRWIGLGLLFGGGWAFGWLVLQRVKNSVIAVLSAGLLLTSPVLAYYGPGFLPDAPAFCFVLLMLGCLLMAHERQSIKWLFVAGSAGALAISLKLSMAILPIAMILAWVCARHRQSWPRNSIWNSKWPGLVAGVATLVVLLVRWWITNYNAAHHAMYFLSSTRPVWHYDWPFIRQTLLMTFRFGWPAFTSAGLYLLSFWGLYRLLICWKSIFYWIRCLLVFTASGCVAYTLLWFRMLREHDYYFICLLVMPLLLFWVGLSLWIQHYRPRQLVWGLAMCFLLSAWHNGLIMSKRLHLAFHPASLLNLPPDAFFPAQETPPLPLSAKVLCPHDPSPNIALFALQRQGWTAYNFGERMTADTLQKYQTQFGLSHLALRDTAYYSALYQDFFPNKAGGARGWYFYAR